MKAHDDPDGVHLSETAGAAQMTWDFVRREIVPIEEEIEFDAYQFHLKC